MEVIIGIAVGVLVVVLIFGSIGIVFAVRTKCCSTLKDNSDNQTHNNPDGQLIEEEEGDDVSITLQNVLEDDIWIDDMTGVMNHCIPILRGCHDLTSRLVPITMKACESEADNRKIEETALEVKPRLDDVVQLLEGPLDPRLVEARCTSLYYSVSNLCLVIKGILKDADDISNWIDSSLLDTENHLKILQAETQKLYRRSISGSIRGRGVKDSSPVGELSLSGTHSNSSSSHTDSAESGIDLQTPSEQGSEHAIHAPSNDNNQNGEVAAPTKYNGKPHVSTIAEVHVHDITPVEVIEMNSFSNNGYTATE